MAEKERGDGNRIMGPVSPGSQLEPTRRETPDLDEPRPRRSRNRAFVPGFLSAVVLIALLYGATGALSR
jgi:hypothetical protein